MKHLIYASIVVALAVTAAMWMGGCPGSGAAAPDAGGGTSGADGSTGDSDPADEGADGDELVDAEENAVTAAAQSAEALAQAVNTAQSPTGSEDQEDGSTLDLPTIDGEATFGLCPEVSLTAASDGLLTFDLSIDFGEGCYPYDSTEYACSGTASGSFDQGGQSISMEFDNISCEGATLTGEVDATYDRSATSVDLEGSWDLTYVDSEGTVLTSGTGAGTYDWSDYVTTIASFEGTVTDTVDTWNTVMSGIKVSFPTYECFMPYAGEMTISGSSIRTFVIRFNEDSPTTGVVEVSVNGRRFVEVNVYALE